MAPKHHPTPLSGGDRKALTKELGKARAMTGILAAQSAEMRAKGAALIQQADRLLCVKAGTSGCGAMANRSTPRQQLTKRSTAAFPGWKSSVHVARRRTTSIWQPSSTR